MDYERMWYDLKVWLIQNDEIEVLIKMNEEENTEILDRKLKK